VQTNAYETDRQTDRQTEREREREREREGGRETWCRLQRYGVDMISGVQLIGLMKRPSASASSGAPTYSYLHLVAIAKGLAVAREESVLPLVDGKNSERKQLRAQAALMWLTTEVITSDNHAQKSSDCRRATQKRRRVLRRWVSGEMWIKRQT
jgi:hypothetical protein